MVTMREYYKLLEVPWDASDDDIRKAYRRAAMRWHPDKNPETEQYAERKFKEITEAYDVLSDNSKRDLYDRYGKDGLAGAAEPGGPTADEGASGHIFNFASIRDIFREFFWGREPFYDVPDNERSDTGAAGNECCPRRDAQEGGNDVSEFHVGWNESQADYELPGVWNESHYEYKSVPACESREEHASYDGWSWPEGRPETMHACELHEEHMLYDGWSWPEDRDEPAPVYEPHAAWSQGQDRPGSTPASELRKQYVLYDEWIGTRDRPESSRVYEVPAGWRKLQAGRSEAAEWKQATAAYDPAPGYASPYEWNKSAASCDEAADRNQPVAAGESRPAGESRELPCGRSLLSGGSKGRQSDGMEKLLGGMRKLLHGTKKLLCRRSELCGGLSPVPGEPCLLSKGSSGLHGTRWPRAETNLLQGRMSQQLHETSQLPDITGPLQDGTSQLTGGTGWLPSVRSSLRYGTSRCPNGISRPPGGMSRLPDITSHLLGRTSRVPGRRHLGVQSSDSSCSRNTFIARLGRMLSMWVSKSKKGKN